MRAINIPKENLIRLYIDQNLPARECGYVFGCTPKTIYTRLRQYQLHVRTNSEAREGKPRPYRKKPILESKLRQLYVEQKFSMVECGKRFNCSNVTIKNRLTELGIYVRNLSESHKQYKWPEERKKSWVLKVKGKNNPMYGVRGKDAPNWKNGLSREPYPLEWRETLRESIRQRDNYICQKCHMPQRELLRKLSIHHIDYIKENLDPENLISLCNACNCEVNFNREYWINYFRTILDRYKRVEI